MSDDETMSIYSVDSTTRDVQYTLSDNVVEGEPWVDLYNGKEMILSPFHDIGATFPRFELVWAVENRDGTQTRYVLCHRWQGPAPPGREMIIPLLFDNFGEVVRDGCQFTSRGITAGRTAEEIREAPMATCWFQHRPHDKLSIINWRTTSDVVHMLANLIPGSVMDTSMLFRNHNGIPQLKLRWQGFPGETAAGALPMYNQNGIRHSPASLAVFPFDKGFHAGFTINMHHDGDVGDRTLYANLLRLVRA